MLRSVLIVDDDASMRHLLSVILDDHGYEPRAVGSGEQALEELAQREVDLVLTDVRMPGMGGIAFLRAVKDRDPLQMVIVMSAYGSHDHAIEAMKAGAYDYLQKPFRPDEVVLVLRKAEERERLFRENIRLRGELARSYRPEGLVATTEGMRELTRQIGRVAPQKSTVLITGESGTGKELVARALHERSPRASFPFVAVNCGAIPETLLESELFGHVRGAFTDAVRNKKGLAAEADGGTLFLDEIGELPLSLQPKLLRFLEDEEVRAVGDVRSRKVDVRVIAATARDLKTAVADGHFREDLYWRLAVVPLRVPPLRERREDIDPLAEQFLARYAALRPEWPNLRLSDEARALLSAYSWPGNVRELEHALERAAVMAEEQEIKVSDLPEELRERPSERKPVRMEGGLAEGGDLSVKRRLQELEASLIRAALEQTQGNRTKAAELLDISYGALLYKIRDYKLS